MQQWTLLSHPRNESLAPSQHSPLRAASRTNQKQLQSSYSKSYSRCSNIQNMYKEIEICIEVDLEVGWWVYKYTWRKRGSGFDWFGALLKHTLHHSSHSASTDMNTSPGCSFISKINIQFSSQWDANHPDLENGGSRILQFSTLPRLYLHTSNRKICH